MTKDEFEEKYSNITRTDILPFISWERFKHTQQISFIGFDGLEYVLDITHSLLYLWKITINEYNECFWDVVRIEYLTEENYYKCYEICRKLFVGESIEDEGDD